MSTTNHSVHSTSSGFAPSPVRVDQLEQVAHVLHLFKGFHHHCLTRAISRTMISLCPSSALVRGILNVRAPKLYNVLYQGVLNAYHDAQRTID